MAELRREAIGEARGAHLGDRFAARGQHQIAGDDGVRFALAGQRGAEVASVVGDLSDLGLQPQGGGLHLGQQHRDNVLGAVVAEELPEGFFVPCNAVAIHEVDEIPLGITAERGLGEMLVFAQKVVGACV